MNYNTISFTRLIRWIVIYQVNCPIQRFNYPRLVNKYWTKPDIMN